MPWSSKQITRCFSSVPTTVGKTDGTMSSIFSSISAKLTLNGPTRKNWDALFTLLYERKKEKPFKCKLREILEVLIAANHEFDVEAILSVVSIFGHHHPIPQSPENQRFEVKRLDWPDKCNTFDPKEEMERRCQELIETLFTNPPQNPDFFKVWDASRPVFTTLFARRILRCCRTLSSRTSSGCECKELRRYELPSLSGMALQGRPGDGADSTAR